MKNNLLLRNAIILALTLAISSGFSNTAFCKSSKTHPGRTGPLNEREMEMAKTAWKYFENNYQSSTGLVNSVDNYPSTTLWDIGSYIAALVSAKELDLINNRMFDERLSKLLGTMNKIEFFNNELPNKSYNTKTLEKTLYNNDPGDNGYSAIDIARYLLWLKIVKERYPKYANEIDLHVLKFNFSKMINDKGALFGSSLSPSGKIQYHQEGRLGYEEYAAKCLALWGFNTTAASKLEPYSFKKIYDIDIPVDDRDLRKYGAHNAIVTETFMLDGIEFNWDLPDDKDSDYITHTDTIMKQEFADRIYKVQETRFFQDGILTARSEHQLDTAPYFVYDAIYSDGYRWNTLDTRGQFVPHFAAVSSKAAILMWALYETPYTDFLFYTVRRLQNPQRGIYEGIYEQSNKPIYTYTTNNNGIILEALLYKTQGKLLKFNKNFESLWDQYIREGRADEKGILEKQIRKSKSN